MHPPPNSHPHRKRPCDQAINTLEALVDMGIPIVCNKWLTLPPNPAILSLDELLEPASAQKRSHRRTAAAGIVLKKTKNCDFSGTDSPRESLDDSLSLNQSQVRINYANRPRAQWGGAGPGGGYGKAPKQNL